MYESFCCNCMNDVKGRFPCPLCGAPFTFENEPDALKPRTVLNYSSSPILIGRCLGIGGFGATYLGLDALNQKVAVKEFLPRQIARRVSGTLSVFPIKTYEDIYDYSLNNFLEEAKTIARFREYSNIVSVLNFFKENNTAYFTMIYKEGQTLDKYVKMKAKEGGITEEDLLIIIKQILNGLKIIHKEKLLHRDIKPSNIYVPEEGEAFLLDFGAARQMMESYVSNAGFSVYLTRGYAPPEQYNRQDKQGPYTDIYALSATLYVCLRGKMTMDTLDVLPDSLEICIGEKQIEPIQTVSRKSITQALSKAIMVGLRCSPDERPQTATEFYDLLPNETSNKQKEFSLKVCAGEFKDEIIPLDSKVLLVGKHPDQCDLILQNKSISRQHCRFYIENNVLFLENFKPLNGTYLNNQKQADNSIKKITSGDIIRLADNQVFEVIETYSSLQTKYVQPELPVYQDVYAGFWKRFVAFLIDGVIISGLTILIFFIRAFEGILTNSVEWRESPFNYWVTYYFIYAFVFIIYFSVMESSKRQATWGKWFLEMKVTDLKGERISFIRAIGRCIGKILSTLIFGLGFITIIFTRRKQALHDMFSKCIIVNK